MHTQTHQTKNMNHMNGRGRGKPPGRPVAWRPQPSSLSREELRRIVLQTIG